MMPVYDDDTRSGRATMMAAAAFAFTFTAAKRAAGNFCSAAGARFWAASRAIGTMALHEARLATMNRNTSHYFIAAGFRFQDA